MSTRNLTCLFSAAALLTFGALEPRAEDRSSDNLIGHGALRYRVDRSWCKADPSEAPVFNAHALVEDEQGRIYLVTDHPANAFLVLEKDGRFVRSFGEGIPGGHGVDLIDLDGEEHLIHVDCGWHVDDMGQYSRTNGAVRIMTKTGDIVLTLPSPHTLGLFAEKDRYQPCDVAVTPNGDILVADGYASDKILHYKANGVFVRQWGGRNEGQPDHLENAHGISIDTADPTQPKVWVSSRSQNQLKTFTLDGEYLGAVSVPGAYAGQVFFRGDHLYTGVCWSKENGVGKRLNQSGFVLFLDRRTLKAVSAPGGSAPRYDGDVLLPLHQTTPVFHHVHDLYVDRAGDIYVGEWNAGRRYPFKLTLAP
jgi:hypothetical protein